MTLFFKNYYYIIQVPTAKFRTWPQREVSTDEGSNDYLRGHAEKMPTNSILVQKWFRKSRSEQTGTKKATKGDQRDPKEPKGRPKGARRGPKVAQRHPKGARREPTATKMEPKGVKREPKGDQNASKNRLGRQGRFWERKWAYRPLLLGSILGPFSTKNRCKNRYQKRHGK